MRVVKAEMPKEIPGRGIQGMVAGKEGLNAGFAKGVDDHRPRRFAAEAPRPEGAPQVASELPDPMGRIARM